MAKSAAVWPKVQWPVTRAELALADSTSGPGGGDDQTVGDGVDIALEMPYAVGVDTAEVGQHQVFSHNFGVAFVGAGGHEHFAHHGVQFGGGFDDHRFSP